MVVVVGPVPERVNSCNNTGVIRNNSANTPGIICVACNDLALVVGNGNNIPLQVLKEIVCVVVVDNTANGILVVVERNKGVFAPGFLENLSSVKGIGVGYAVYSLACSYTVCIVGISVTVKGLKLTSLFPDESMTEILRRVTLSIVFKLYSFSQIMSIERTILPSPS